MRGRLYMPGQRYELHHKICNLRYGTPGYGMSAYKGRWRQNAVILDVLWFANHKRAHLPEFRLWVLPLVTWIVGFSDWISMECMFKILQFHNLWDNECKMDEYCFRFALWRWNSPFVEASAEHKCSERFIAMFNATKHNIRPFHIHVFVNMSDCNILFITEIIKFNLKIRNTTYRRQFISETPLTPDRF